MVTWLNQYNQGKYLPLNKRRSKDPCLVNDKASHPSSNVNVTYYGSARKEKSYEEHLYEDDGSNMVCTVKMNFPRLQRIPLPKPSTESAKELETPKTRFMSELHPSIHMVVSGYHENRKLVCTTARLAGFLKLDA